MNSDPQRSQVRSQAFPPVQDLLFLFLLALGVRILAVIPVHWPGYMDAAYSYNIARNLIEGGGLNEPFLWNYLDHPAGIPHPSHLYWMPLPTLLAALSMAILGVGYRAAQVPFISLSALLPLVSYGLAIHVTGRRGDGWIAGLLTVFSGFYVPYWGQTDNFAPFAVMGCLALLAGAKLWTPEASARWKWWALGAGAAAGLAHLCRADGPLLLLALWLPGLVCLVAPLFGGRRRVSAGQASARLLWMSLGYLLVMLPWSVRNVLAVGAVLPTSGTQSLWLTGYDDLFSFGRQLSWRSYLAWGWSNILRSKLDALWLNLQTVFAVWGMVFLAPLAAVGFWQLRRRPVFRLAMAYGLLLFLAMTFAFTFPGPRGGLLHSGGALLPFICVAALVGLRTAVAWIAHRRSTWDAESAGKVFGVGLVVLAILFSAYISYSSLIVNGRWNRDELVMRRTAEAVQQANPGGAPVLIGDPSLYWYVSHSPALVVPNEALDVLLAVADTYGAQFLVLDTNRPAPLAPVYHGDLTHPRLVPLDTSGLSEGSSIRLWRIDTPNR